MNFIKIFSQDIKRAIYQQRYRYIIVLIMITLLMLIPTNIADSINKKIPEVGNMNFLDNVFYMLSGCEHVIPEKIKDIKIPFSWMSIQFLCGLVTFDYIQYDQNGIGKAIILRTKSKLAWWLSKCLSMICLVIGVYILLFVVSAVVALINYRLSGELHMDLLSMVLELNNTYIVEDGMIIYIFTVPILVSIGITLFQAAISQYLSPVIGLAVVLSIDVMSVFSNSVLLWGNWSMILRSSLCLQDGLDVWKSIAAGIVTGITGVVSGGIRFCKKDIL